MQVRWLSAGVADGLRPQRYNLALVLVPDFEPTPEAKRTFSTIDYACFWITMVISITT